MPRPAKASKSPPSADGTARGKPVDFEGGLTLFSNRGFVNYRGTEYEIDPSNYGIAKPLFFPALAEKGGAEIRECRRAASGIEVGDLLDNLSDDGSVEVAGTETTKISGELDVAAAVEAFVDFVEDPACSAQFEALSPFALYKVRLLGEELAARRKSPRSRSTSATTASSANSAPNSAAIRAPVRNRSWSTSNSP